MPSTSSPAAIETVTGLRSLGRAGSRIANALERIADALELAVRPVASDDGDAAKCLHPAEARFDFGITDGIEDWQCRLCGYRTTAEPKVS